MTHEHDQHRKDSPITGATPGGQIEPGQSSRSALLRKPEHAIASRLVQRKAVVIGGDGGDGAAHGERVHQAAAEGIRGAGGALPHGDAIQRSFGRHRVAHIEAHTDGAARAGARAMGAEAYATGHHVAFGGAPSLHTAAHEAAHVVQQAAGVHLAGGVGQAGDAYERHADAVADQVVRGDSAEALLDDMVGHGGRGAGGPSAVQHKLVPGPRTAAENVQALVSFLNAMCYGAYRFGVASDGSITIDQGDFTKLEGLPPKTASKIDQFGNVLARVLLAPEPVAIDFVAGSKFIIGNFDGQGIDLGDIQQILAAGRDDGDDPIDFYGTLAHEITEQYDKQVGGQDYETAHGQASELEFSITGWRRISERMLESTQHEDSTYTGVSELVYRREAPPHDTRTIHMTIARNKITALQTVPGSSSQPSGTSKPERKENKRKHEDDQTPDKSLLQQFLDDLEDEDGSDTLPSNDNAPPGKRDDDGTGGGGTGLGGGGGNPIVQQQVVQMVTGEIRGEDEYRTLFCLSQGWKPSGAPQFEIDDGVKAAAQRYADGIIDAAYNEAERQLQRALNGAQHALGKLDGVPDGISDLVHANLVKAVPAVGEFDGDALRRVVLTLGRIYATLKACTFDALNDKPLTSLDTIAYANPGVNVIHLLAPFYTYQTDARTRGLTLVHECAHIVHENIQHNEEVWYLNAYTWERITNILDQLGQFLLQQAQQ